MAKAKIKTVESAVDETPVTLLSVYKEKNDGDVFCSSYGVIEVVMPAWVIAQYGVEKSKVPPDAAQYFLMNLNKKAREILDI